MRVLDRRWLRRLDRTLANVPEWRLMQELQRRGGLRPAPASEAGYTKGERLSGDAGLTVDSYGVPLMQVCFEGEPIGQHPPDAARPERTP